ncbi:MAG: NUDIX domain-containing protein [Magnetococcales bacterium]|nr:NUDIX domain-containing protein [Magnetococcales bacterium]
MIRTTIRPCGLLVREHRLLTLLYQYEGHDRHNLPGGNLEPGEAILDCLVREFAEELDLAVQPGELLFSAETLAGDKHTLHLAFRLACQNTSPRLNPDQVKASRLCWLDADALQQVSLYPAIGSALVPFLRGAPIVPAFLGRVAQPWYG